MFVSILFSFFLNLPLIQIKRSPSDLDAVLAESMRFSRTTEAVYRTTSQDFVLDGHSIPVGTDVQLLQGAAGRRVAAEMEKPGPTTGWGTPDVDVFRYVVFLVSSRPWSVR